jgi:DNA polymerase-1
MSDSLDYKLVTTLADLEALCAELSTAEIIAVDTETEGLEYADIIVGIALSHKPGFGRYIPIRHEAVDGIRYDNQLEPKVVFDLLRPILETVPCTGHNSKFDLKMFWKDGVDVNYTDDTMIMAHVLGIDANGSRGLKQLVKSRLGHDMGDLASLFTKVGNRKVEIKPKILSPEEIEDYGCEDGLWSLLLYNNLNPIFTRHPKMRSVYNLEMRLLRVVAEMESFGVPVSMDFLVDNGKKADAFLTQFREVIMKEICKELNDPDYEINFKSPVQLAKLLFEHLQLPIIKYSQKTQNPSTDASVLQELAKLSPVVQRILTLRALEKLNNTYLTGLQSEVNGDFRIRGSFNQVGTASGRFSSSKPNLQNLPKDQTFTLWEIVGDTDVEDHFLNMGTPVLGRGDSWEWQAFNSEVGTWGDGYLGKFEGKEYGVTAGRIYEVWRCKTRDFIEAPKDHYLMEADYSQVELRIMAGESQEPTLLDAYNSGDDVHRRTAGVIFDTAFEEVTDELRHIGKTVNFSLLYGAGAYNIAAQLNIPVEEATDIVNKYFTNLASVQSWITRVKQDTKMDGYADTVAGRRRYFHNVRGSDKKLAEKELREAVNHHIQGAAADVMKTALVRASISMRQYFGDKVKIISTVHDSLLLECHNSCDKSQVLRVLKRAMEDISFENAQRKALAAGEVDKVTVITGWPHLEIDAKVGSSWGSSKKFTTVSEDYPEKIDQSVLPRVRVRKVAIERESSDHVDVKWRIEIKKPLTDGGAWLFDFLEKRAFNDGAEVSLTFTLPDGTIYDKDLNARYQLSFADESEIRLHLGPCTLSQEMDSMDYGEVLRGIDFGIQ